MRMQPLLAYWLHSEVDEGAQEKRSLLSTHTYSPLQISTHLYRSLLHRWGCSAGQGRRDWIEAVVLRCVPWRVHLRTSGPVNFAKRGNVSVFLWMLSRGGFACDCHLWSRLNGWSVKDVREGLEYLPGFSWWWDSKKDFTAARHKWHGMAMKLQKWCTGCPKKCTHRTKS